MQVQRHALLAQSLGPQREVISLHFGPQGQGKKVYLQAGLHADEHPGMLALHHLKSHLQELENAGRLTGEVVLVPIANPIGLGNYVFGRQLGRFELSSRENFNRNYRDLAELVCESIDGELGSDPAANVTLIRRCIRERLDALQPRTELESLRLTLLRLACAADYVIDVHCDSEAMVHLYVHSEQQAEARVLAGLTGAHAVLHATEQGGPDAAVHAFDESFTAVWYKLRQRFPNLPIPMATFSATLELRGLHDVSHELAKEDTAALLAYLGHLGLIADAEVNVPEPVCEPTPLAGVEVLNAPHAGVIAYRTPIGTRVDPGTALVDVIDPVNGRVSTLYSSISGMFYARVVERFTEANTELTFVAGHKPVRSGSLLCA
ncbi:MULTISPECIES: succinylglutamate desuccinylase/aspartoacylase family protein [Pseudomonas]|uniref:Succinylglutamate desuccinylase/aspartoacylase n=1 Tax=Pseudomonas putida TaxID=303 RepID=A0A6S5TNW6_PSEPU|nr:MULTISPECIES: succinylglutamate desuccinylase/aspartoacylase family protein [Pseudomonas]AVH38200.1 succinylglutamate desuccinylase [Pseudomonas monteilii]MBH3377754.1 succinylglutamate desuccinylase/aspartoacylase family protein [Pseudomonas asiatica]MBR7519411.1 succinylglutamate desuccinylase/aspartoacylase family protein [Pseudomonas juntendi]BBT42270.1 succinylglutamate desuccinylase/aspartoacylase [Pseudomonas putida]